ncbi:MAG: ROK family protein [Pseudomonadota bacterium]
MRLGIDFGGTKIEGVMLDDGGVERARARLATPRHDYAGCLTAITDLVTRLEGQVGAGATRIGVGVPGAVDRRRGTVSLGNATWLHDRMLGDDLSDALGRPVRIANDANCFALSEARDGAGAGAEVVMGVILGTGVGGGVVVRGQLVEGRNAVTGELGHVPLPMPTAEEMPGPICSCGRRGCAEAWLSGPALAADHARVNGEGHTPTAAEIVAAAEAGDGAAEATLTRYEDRLGRVLALPVNLIDPDVIVLGGGLSNVGRFYRTVPRAMAPHIFGPRFETRLVRNRFGDSSGVRGAAWLWDAEAELAEA